MLQSSNCSLLACGLRPTAAQESSTPRARPPPPGASPGSLALARSRETVRRAQPLSCVRLFATPWNFLGKNTGVGRHFLLQGIFLSHGSNTSCTGRQRTKGEESTMEKRQSLQSLVPGKLGHYMQEGLPWGLSSQCRRLGFNPWVRKISWKRKWQLTPVFLHGESHGQRSLVGYSPWGYKELHTTK